MPRDHRASQPPLVLVERAERVSGRQAIPHSRRFETGKTEVPDGSHLDAARPLRAPYVLELRKKPLNPFPERITVGRAGNCDLVIDEDFISKLHACFLVESHLPLRLSDQGSANGTWVNRRQLTAGSAVEIRPGDRIRFGALEFEVVSRTTAAASGSG